jgi:hypothetical protein
MPSHLHALAFHPGLAHDYQPAASAEASHLQAVQVEAGSQTAHADLVIAPGVHAEIPSSNEPAGGVETASVPLPLCDTVNPIVEVPKLGLGTGWARLKLPRP